MTNNGQITPTSQISVNNSWTEPSHASTVVPFPKLLHKDASQNMRKKYESLLSFPDHIAEVVNKMF